MSETAQGIRATAPNGWWVEARIGFPTDPVKYRTSDSPEWEISPTGQQSANYRCMESVDLIYDAVGWCFDDQTADWLVSWADDEEVGA